MGRKTLKQSVGEAHDIVTTAWALARVAVAAGVSYAEVGKVLRGAMERGGVAERAARYAARGNMSTIYYSAFTESASLRPAAPSPRRA